MSVDTDHLRRDIEDGIYDRLAAQFRSDTPRRRSHLRSEAQRATARIFGDAS